MTAVRIIRIAIYFVTSGTWKPVYPVWTMPNCQIGYDSSMSLYDYVSMITGVSLLFGNVALGNFNL